MDQRFMGSTALVATLRRAGQVLSMLGAALACTPTLAAPPDSWPMFGADLRNSAAGAATPMRLDRLKPKWVFTTGGDVSARAAIVDGVAYFPDWAGNLWAVDTKTGTKIWGRQLSEYQLSGSLNGVYNSRTSPAVANGVVYIGTQEGAWLLAINAANGTLRWKTQLESPSIDPFALVTASPVVHAGFVYTGVASNQEGMAGFDPTFHCCSAQGSVVAVQTRNGAIAWKTRMVPDGYSGGGVWGSNFVVDPTRGSVFVGTGNNYSHPTDSAPSGVPGKTYGQCLADGGSATSCDSKDNHVDSIVALDMHNGAIKWSRKFVVWNQPGFAIDGSDDWNVACFLPPFTNCPSSAGPDYDFASAPNLITYRDKTTGAFKTILGAGQKSGIYFAMDPDSGASLWQTQVGPGSSLGGMEWGSASDGKRIYVSIANFYGIPTATGAGGSWAALDPATGAILWQVGDPNGSVAIGPLTVAHGAVFASSMAGAAGAPTMLALDVDSGQTLWSFAPGSSVNAGASVVDGVVYWGSGYTHLGIPGFTGNNKFFAFSKDGK